MVLLTACGGAAPAQTGSLAALDRAVGEADRARTALLEVPAAALPVVSAYDDADDAAARGERASARAAEARASAGAAAATPPLDAAAERASAYRDALRELEAQSRTAPGLSAEQRRALADVASGGDAEAAAVEAEAAALLEGWPSYRALGEALRTWLQRAGAGWYRTAGEAANGYAVLVQQLRPGLDRAREQLAVTDEQRRAAVEQQDVRLDVADRALEPLRAPR